MVTYTGNIYAITYQQVIKVVNVYRLASCRKRVDIVMESFKLSTVHNCLSLQHYVNLIAFSSFTFRTAKI